MKNGNRKHPTAAEVHKLIAATKGTRNEARNRGFLLLRFRHGLRVSEACGLDLSQVVCLSRIVGLFKECGGTLDAETAESFRRLGAKSFDRRRGSVERRRRSPRVEAMPYFQEQTLANR